MSDEVIAQRRFLAELIWRNRKIFKADFAFWQERGWFEDPPGTRPLDARPADAPPADVRRAGPRRCTRRLSGPER